MKKCLVSPGSSGAHFIRDVLLIHTAPGGFSEGKKNYGGGHCRFPHQIKSMNYTHVIYPIAHPVEIIISLHRRGFLSKLDHCANLSGNENEMNKYIRLPKSKKTLEKWSSMATRPLLLHEHFIEWSKKDGLGMKIMFVKYEFIHSIANEISTFLEDEMLVQKIKNNFNFRGIRREQLKTDILYNLENKYKKEIEFYNSFENFLIIEK